MAVLELVKKCDGAAILAAAGSERGGMKRNNKYKQIKDNEAFQS